MQIWQNLFTLEDVICRQGGLGVGVADGVYMWKQQGIDSGLFSRSLMRYAEQAIKEGATNPVKGESPCLGRFDLSHVSQMIQVLVHALLDARLCCRAKHSACLGGFHIQNNTDDPCRGRSGIFTYLCCLCFLFGDNAATCSSRGWVMSLLCQAKCMLRVSSALSEGQQH